MNDRDFLAMPSKTKDILAKYNFTFKKSLGQNFLIDLSILKQIVKKSGITEQSGVIEIGPGIGSLTEQLAIHAYKVVAYEIDNRLIPILADTLKDYHNVEIIHDDILKADVKEMIPQQFLPNQDIHIVANLPYYITTPIMMKLLSEHLPISSMTIMIQKEVSDRISASPNNKDYGSLSVAVQYYCTVEQILHVPSSAFKPQPKVDSTVVKLTLRDQPPVQVDNEDFFFTVVRASFAHRRKTLRNNLASHFKNELTKSDIETVLESIEIEGNRRGETLSMHEFAKMANAFNYIKNTH